MRRDRRGAGAPFPTAFLLAFLCGLPLFFASCDAAASSDDRLGPSPKVESSGPVAKPTEAEAVEKTTLEAEGPAAADPEPDPDEVKKRLAEGRLHFSRRGCIACHKTQGYMSMSGPNLSKVGARLTAEDMRVWIANPKKKKPTTLMPVFDGTPDELDRIVDYLQSLR